MKKLISFLFMLILLTGCSITSMEEASISQILEETLYKETENYNSNKIGYRYYLPRTFNVSSDREYNESFVTKNHKYYLYVDIVSYYNKSDFEFTPKENLYYSKHLENNGKKGYLEITKIEDYFLIEMMYNYSKIEVLTEEHEIKEVLVNASNILASVKYNDAVLDNLVGESKLNFEEVSYDIFKPKNAVSNKTFLDYYEEYEGEYDSSVEDSDVIN